ncbi:surfeit locus protein 6 homolog [Contarinia nasturtii]|uniref:surfeit locus protein 6 homolog n=1 Tax=Contarinia nasturtii TaxID=265458 RepID=UPI0012D38C76|nr:surfeit locus protein 6 homolog [Contarinia nasturtii]
MQMKMDKKMTQKFDKQQIRRILEFENEFISSLFDSFEVPDSIEDETFDEQFLLKTKERAGKAKLNARKTESQPSVDMEQRLEIIRNKMKSKKTKPSARAIEKKKQKKLKKTKELKKKLISVAKSLKNEKVKEGKNVNSSNVAESNGVDVTPDPDIKPDIKPAKVFNEEGKMVFSKFEFAAQASRAKKTKKDKTIKDPKLLIKKLKQEKEQINELVSQGEVEKAEELKKNIAWQKAFDKTEGKKVKDNVSLLHKTLHKKKVEKKKSKEQWKQREQKIEKEKESKAKRREENINKKKDEKKKHKLKKASKRGRVIAGY